MALNARVCPCLTPEVSITSTVPRSSNGEILLSRNGWGMVKEKPPYC